MAGSCRPAVAGEAEVACPRSERARPPSSAVGRRRPATLGLVSRARARPRCVTCGRSLVSLRARAGAASVAASMVGEAARLGFRFGRDCPRWARCERLRGVPASVRLGYHPPVPRTIHVDELPDIARGCSVLGAGGGGEAYTATLMAIQAIADHGPVELVGYDDLPHDGIVMSCGFLGAPTVTIEKLSSGDEGQYLREEVERPRGAPVAALMCAEIGGSNGMVPFTWAAKTGAARARRRRHGARLPRGPAGDHAAGRHPGRAGRGRGRARPSRGDPPGRRVSGRSDWSGPSPSPAAASPPARSTP